MDDTTAPVAEDPADVFLDGHDIARRYRKGKTWFYEVLAKRSDWLRSLIPGGHLYSLEALRRWELAVQLEGTPAEPRPDAAPIVLAPPAPRPAGRPRTKES